VPFAQELAAYLKARGFDHEDILHYTALCYQLRRAFYFIARGLVGRSVCMKKLRESLWNNVFTCDLDLYNEFLWSRMEDFSTLILGETGTGKGTAARAIGMSGFIPFDEKKGCFTESFSKTFLPLNISQFSENLIESELFGHKKGSFTGAVDDHKGIFDQCSPYGAIFLDEIGEMTVPVQIKLLKILEERVFCPVGSHAEHRFEGRIIAATNKDIEGPEARTHFRSDFFYRLCSDVIVVPPLRERIAEDPLELDDLISHTVEKIVGKPSSSLSAMVKQTIIREPGRNYPWPGNVRELNQCVRRILLKRTYSVNKEKADLTGQVPGLTIHNEQGFLSASDVLQSYCKLLYDRHGTLGEVARITRLDRRTVKKYIYS
jgi:transcriptional regulator with GAF, ATPase, and Fis domain